MRGGGGPRARRRWGGGRWWGAGGVVGVVAWDLKRAMRKKLEARSSEAEAEAEAEASGRATGGNLGRLAVISGAANGRACEHGAMLLRYGSAVSQPAVRLSKPGTLRCF